MYQAGTEATDHLLMSEWTVTAQYRILLETFVFSMSMFVLINIYRQTYIHSVRYRQLFQLGHTLRASECNCICFAAESLLLLNLLPPQRRLRFQPCLLVGMLACEQNYTKIIKIISTKLGLRTVQPRKDPISFWCGSRQRNRSRIFFVHQHFVFLNIFPFFKGIIHGGSWWKKSDVLKCPVSMNK